MPGFGAPESRATRNLSRGTASRQPLGRRGPEVWIEEPRLETGQPDAWMLPASANAVSGPRSYIRRRSTAKRLCMARASQTGDANISEDWDPAIVMADVYPPKLPVHRSPGCSELRASVRLIVSTALSSLLSVHTDYRCREAAS